MVSVHDPPVHTDGDETDTDGRLDHEENEHSSATARLPETAERHTRWCKNESGGWVMAALGAARNQCVIDGVFPNSDQ